MIDASTATSPLRPMTSVESAAYEFGVAPLSCVWEDDNGWHAVSASGRIVDGEYRLEGTDCPWTDAWA